MLEWLVFAGMSATPTPRLLLVSRPSDADEIERALVGAGFSAPAFAAGGDDTLTLYEETAPDVVVLSASLDQGDARSLASAMRAGPKGSRLRIVLVGDAGGPIRNALDAADFEVDRFVGRPLSPKALAFAVRECARDQEAEAMAGRAGASSGADVDRVDIGGPRIEWARGGGAGRAATAGDASGRVRAATAGDASGRVRAPTAGDASGRVRAPTAGDASGRARAATAGDASRRVRAATADDTGTGGTAAGSGGAARAATGGDAGAATAGGVGGAAASADGATGSGATARAADAAGSGAAAGAGGATASAHAAAASAGGAASGPAAEKANGSGQRGVPAHGVERTGTAPMVGGSHTALRVRNQAGTDSAAPSERTQPRWPTPRPLPPPPERYPIMRSGTVPGTGPALPPGPVGRPPRGATSPGLDRAMEEAISRFVSDAMTALDPGWPVDPERDGKVQETIDDPTARTVGARTVGSGPAIPDEEPAAPMTPTAAPPGVPVAPATNEGIVDSAPPSASWDEPPPAPTWREPTLILRGGGQTMTRPAPPTRPQPVGEVDVDTTDAVADSPWEAGASHYPRAVRVDDAPLDEAELSEPEGEARSPVARELRRKMSMMAERLFPGRGGDRARLDVGLSHDAHAEIDLAAIGVDPDGSTPYEAIGSVDTFADTNQVSRMAPTPAEAIAADDREETTGRRRSIGTEPPARGDLADIDVATLIGRLVQSGFTGRVQFKRGPAEKAIHFEAGKPVFAISNLPHDRMGDLLYREGKITREQQQRARDLVVESGRRMGEILVEIGFLKPRELLPAVRHHIEDIVYSLFAWDSGEYAITAAEPTSERIRLTRHPAAIVLEGVRRKYGPEMLEARLGSAAAVVAVRSQRQLGSIAGVADLSPSERAVIQKLDGERTIQQVAEAAQVDHVVALQLAFGLVALGVAEVVEHGSSPAERPPARTRSLVGETDIAIDRQRVLAKHALVNEADYFTLLGVRRDATSFEIRRAYEAARRDYAATGFPTELQRELAGELGEINRMIDEAYQVLRDERVRRSYQANLLD